MLVPSRSGWYVANAVGAGTHLIDGPYATRDECISSCVRHSSELTIVRAHYSGHVALLYAPKYVHVRVQEASNANADRPRASTTQSTQGIPSSPQDNNQRGTRRERTHDTTHADSNKRAVPPTRSVMHSRAMGGQAELIWQQLEQLTHNQLVIMAHGLGLALHTKPNNSELRLIIIEFVVTGARPADV